MTKQTNNARLIDRLQRDADAINVRTLTGDDIPGLKKARKTITGKVGGYVQWYESLHKDNGPVIQRLGEDVSKLQGRYITPEQYGDLARVKSVIQGYLGSTKARFNRENGHKQAETKTDEIQLTRRRLTRRGNEVLNQFGGNQTYELTYVDKSGKVHAIGNWRIHRNGSGHYVFVMTVPNTDLPLSRPRTFESVKAAVEHAQQTFNISLQTTTVKDEAKV